MDQPLFVIPAPGQGNMGDEAMLLAICENTAGLASSRTILCSRSHYSSESVERCNFAFRDVRGLTHGRHLRHGLAKRAFTKMVTSGQLWLVGADTMDGAYSVRSSVNKWKLLEMAAARGVQSRVLGFSWNSSPHPLAVQAMLDASRQGTQLIARDPVSAERLRAVGAQTVIDGADLVFSLAEVDGLDMGVRSIMAHAQSRNLALVNVSALVRKTVDATLAYHRVLDVALDSDLKPVLIPHVVRPTGSDRAAMDEVWRSYSRRHEVMRAPLLPPPAVKALLQQSRVVVSGRMHLAIMALSHGVPALTIATQGKVEGLMQLFESPELVIDIEKVTQVLDQRFESVMADSTYETKISSSLEHVRRLSQRNFEVSKA